MAKAKPKTRTVYRTKVTAAAKRGVSMAAKAAWQEKATITGLVAGGALGYLEGSGKKLPHIEKLGVSGTWGLGLYGGGKFMKSPTMVMAGTALMAIALYQMAFAAGFKELLKEKAATPEKKPATSGLAQLLGITDDQAALVEQEVSEVSGTVPG